MDIQRIGTTVDTLGEGPVWCDREQALYWVDIRRPAVQRYDLRTGAAEAWPMPEMVGSLAVREKGGLLLGMQSTISFFDPSTGSLERCAAPESGKPHMRFNDGKCDRQGRFWAGTINDVQRLPDGTLYRLDADLHCSAMFGQITVPNGLCWSPDGSTMYFADSQLKTIFSFDFDTSTGQLGERLVFARTEGPGVPDGATVDAQGYLWCAEYGGWRVTRFAPDGRLDRVISLPVQQPTSCAFGGAGYDTLFVTTAAQRLTEEQRGSQPLSGGLLALDVGVRGLPEPRFAG